jgi:hypothetical protein
LNPASTSFVLGYHGCDIEVADRVISGTHPLEPSKNDYDWLGAGIYFWEHNPGRAFDFACEVSNWPRNPKQKIKVPAVVGAIIDLGSCLNLLDTASINLVRQAHADLVEILLEASTPLPENSVGDDLLVRRLDCAVINSLHAARDAKGERAFDTVRAAFFEGDRLYPHAGFAAKNHIQICIRNPACIKGYFRPLDENGKLLPFPPTPTATA